MGIEPATLLLSNDNAFPVQCGAGKRARRGQGGSKVVPRFSPSVGIGSSGRRCRALMSHIKLQYGEKSDTSDDDVP